MSYDSSGSRSLWSHAMSLGAPGNNGTGLHRQYGCHLSALVEKPKDIATASFVDLPETTAHQPETFDGLAMEKTYDVLDPTQKTAWMLLGTQSRQITEEVLVMAG